MTPIKRRFMSPLHPVVWGNTGLGHPTPRKYHLEIPYLIVQMHVLVVLVYSNTCTIKLRVGKDKRHLPHIITEYFCWILTIFVWHKVCLTMIEARVRVFIYAHITIYILLIICLHVTFCKLYEYLEKYNSLNYKEEIVLCFYFVFCLLKWTVSGIYWHGHILNV